MSVQHAGLWHYKREPDHLHPERPWVVRDRDLDFVADFEDEAGARKRCRERDFDWATEVESWKS